MIKIENTAVVNFDVAVRAMRNSWDSWEKSDSEYETFGHYELGKSDKALMQKLIKAGDDHAKFMRFIVVTCDITAPRYWLTQIDTYKVGTVRCSCSTMHTIAKRDFTLDDFSIDDKEHSAFTDVVDWLNFLRKRYYDVESGQRLNEYWRRIIQLLPQSYNQKGTFMMNYQVLRHIYKSRKGHKLSEWREFLNWIEQLPYSELITE